MTSTDLEDGTCLVEVPFLDQHNDHIQLYIEHVADGYRLSDDGYALAELSMSGVELNTEKRRRILGLTLARLGVAAEGGELIVRATEGDLGAKKHALVQAILAVGDMAYMSTGHVREFFAEDVEIFVQRRELSYVLGPNFIGKSGLNHGFNFVLARGNGEPERLVRAINVLDRSHVSDFIFAWSDTKETRPQGSKAIAICNDSERPVSAELAAALRNYEIQTLGWSDKAALLAGLRQTA
jgi:hypothetical protein